MPGRSRVYTSLLSVLVVAVLLAWWGASRSARGQVDVSVDAVMTKGALGARVTIFEFSDYE
jgi:hypothetical protein